MADVTALGASTQQINPVTARPQGSTLDQEAFLRLLVTQMKTQDPTKPMESTEYIAQLASFSQVEQSVQVNNKLDSLLTSSALSLADRDIENAERVRNIRLEKSFSAAAAFCGSISAACSTK